MPLRKSHLYSSLWKSCDELRGGMDASQYKDYIVTLLFMKYISDKYAGDDDFADITVPPGGSFADMVALKGTKEIGEGINVVTGKLADANEYLRDVIREADFSDETKLGKGKELQDRLTKLVGIFQALDFRANHAHGDDLLGDAYEYLMRHFATQSGKSKGQFYTGGCVAHNGPSDRDRAGHQTGPDRVRSRVRFRVAPHQGRRRRAERADHLRAGEGLATWTATRSTTTAAASGYSKHPARKGIAATCYTSSRSLRSTSNGPITVPHGVPFHGNHEAHIRGIPPPRTAGRDRVPGQRLHDHDLPRIDETWSNSQAWTLIGSAFSESSSGEQWF